MAKTKTPYLKWRAQADGTGRPRWEPGPRVRALGFRGQDLKDASGAWLIRGQAIDAAERLNAAVRGALERKDEKSPKAKLGQRGDKSMGDLCDRFRKSQKLVRTKSGKPMAERTKETYLAHIEIIDQWCGDVPVAALSRAAIEEFHGELIEARGAATANSVLRSLKRILYYAVDSLEWVPRNRAAKIDMAHTEGRLVLWTPEEITTFIAAADHLGLASQGDALLLGAMTGQRQNDVIVLTDAQMQTGMLTVTQHKTGQRIDVPVIAPLAARLELAAKRKKKAWPNVTHTRTLVCETDAKAYDDDGSWFRTLFRRVRDAAGGLTMEDEARYDRTPNYPFTPMFSILTKQWLDLRDTAVTYLFAAGCTVAEICTFTGHELKTAQEILDKHYFVRDLSMAKAAGAKLEAFWKNARP